MMRFNLSEKCVIAMIRFILISIRFLLREKRRRNASLNVQMNPQSPVFSL